jgi:hypothetical protein
VPPAIGGRQPWCRHRRGVAIGLDRRQRPVVADDPVAQPGPEPVQPPLDVDQLADHPTEQQRPEDHEDRCGSQRRGQFVAEGREGITGAEHQDEDAEGVGDRAAYARRQAASEQRPDAGAEDDGARVQEGPGHPATVARGPRRSAVGTTG